MHRNMPGSPVLHYLLEFAQTHVHWVSNAIKPSHPLSPPSPPALNFSIPSGSFPVSRLFTSGGQSMGASASESVLLVNAQGWFPLGLTDLVSLLSKGLSRVFSSTTVQKHPFFSTQPYLWSNFRIHTWLLEKTIALTIQAFVGKVISLLFNILSRSVIDFSSRGQRLKSFNFRTALTIHCDFGA